MSEFRQDGARRLELAAELTESICSLPAIATSNWCDVAAEAFIRVHARSVLAITIGDISPDGLFHNIEAAGAASHDIDPERLVSLRRRAVGPSSLGWVPGEPSVWRSARAVRVGGDEAEQDWKGDEPPRVWAELGVVHLLAGGAWLTPETPNRVIIVECGAVAPSTGFDTEDTELLRSTLIPLARKARMVFGDVAADEASFLTPREQQVLELLSLGMSVKQIAAELTRSPHTVHDHVKSLHRKLNASSRGELVARALGHVRVKHAPRGEVDRKLLLA